MSPLATWKDELTTVCLDFHGHLWDPTAYSIVPFVLSASSKAIQAVTDALSRGSNWSLMYGASWWKPTPLPPAGFQSTSSWPMRQPSSQPISSEAACPKVEDRETLATAGLHFHPLTISRMAFGIDIPSRQCHSSGYVPCDGAILL